MTAQEVKGKTLFRAPLQLQSNQIVLEKPKIELSVFRNDETSEVKKIQTKIQLNLGKTTVTNVISRYKTEETEKAEEEFREIIQGLATGEKKIIIGKISPAGARISLKVVDKTKKTE